MTAVLATTPWSTPAARLLLRADVPRAEWLAARRLGLGGSDASTVVGLNPYESRYSLWLDKTGRGTEKDDSAAMEWGRRLEPVIAEWFVDTVRVPVRRAGLMQSRSNPWQLVSVDRLTADGGIAEFKTTSWRTEDAEVWQDGQVPDHAELQSQHGLAVTGRSHSHCVVLIDGRTPLHKVIERDDSLIPELTGIESRFWDTYVLADVEPPVDGSESTTEALRRRYAVVDPDRIIAGGTEVADLVAEFELAKRTAKDADTEVDRVGNKLRQLIGDAEAVAVLGQQLASLRQNGNFSPSRFAKDHPDLFADLQVPATAFDLEALKRDHPHLYAQYRARVLRTHKPKKIGA